MKTMKSIIEDEATLVLSVLVGEYTPANVKVTSKEFGDYKICGVMAAAKKLNMDSIELAKLVVEIMFDKEG